MKTIQITFENGAVFTVPYEVVAENWKQFEKHQGQEPSDDELIDWLYNDMNWSDIAGYATQIKEPPAPDYDEMWSNEATCLIQEK